MAHTQFSNLLAPVPNPWDTMHYPVTELPGYPRLANETAPEYIARVSPILQEQRAKGLIPPAPASSNQSNVTAVFVEINDTGPHEA